MADALAQFNPQSRGAAFILPNGWKTPLDILQQRQQQQRDDQLRTEQQQAEQEQAAAERLGKIIPDVGDYWAPDHKLISDSMQGIRDYTSNMLAAGVDPTHALKNPHEYAKLSQMITEARGLAMMSAQQKKDYDSFVSKYQGIDDGSVRATAAEALLNQYKGAATPQERAKIMLQMERLYDLPAMAASSLKEFEPNEAESFELDGKGGKKTFSISKFSNDQNENMRKTLSSNPKLVEAARLQYGYLSSEEKEKHGGFKPFFDNFIDEAVEARQRTKVKEDYDSDDLYWKWKNYNRQLANDNKAKQEEEDNATDRVKWMESLRTGNIEQAKALINGKLGGKGVVSARFINDKKVAVPGGELSGAKELYGLNQSPVIELEIAVGDVTEDGYDGKEKRTQTRKVKVDMSKPGWQYEINNIYDVLVGEKRKVSPEQFDAAAKKLNLFQEGSQTYSAATGSDDPFADYDQPFADFK